VIQPLDASRNAWRLLWIDLEDPVPTTGPLAAASYYLPTCLLVTDASGRPVCTPEILEELDQQKAEQLLSRLFEEKGIPDRVTIAQSEDWDPEAWETFAQDCRVEIAFSTFPATKQADWKRLAKGLAQRLRGAGFHPHDKVARGLVETSRHLRSEAKRTAHLRKAVEQDAECLEARIELADADYQAARWEESRRGYQEIIDRERRRWSGESPDWWKDPETRPFLRALYGRAMTEWQRGHFPQTAKDLSIILKKNPSDNQGVRFLIPMVHLLAENDAGALEALADYEKNYPGDYCEPSMLFGKGLALWKAGDEEKAGEAYRFGMLRNLHIAPLLLDQPLPPSDLWQPNDRAELSYAQDFIQSYATLWDRDAASLRFLREVQERHAEEIARLMALRRTMHDWQDQRYERNYRQEWKKLTDLDDSLTGNRER
jgi:tetratricopeptide (TPR) repeat protein